MTYRSRTLFPLLCLFACGDDGGSATSNESSSSSTGPNPTTTQNPTTTSASSATADTSSSSGVVDGSSSASSTSGPDTSGSESSSSSGETGGPGVHYDCSAPDGEAPALELVPWLTDIAMPSGMALDPVDPDRVYVRELTGQVHVVQDGVVLPELFLDLSDEEVYCCGNDTGFGGMAMHPNYADNGLFYVHYTASEGETRLMEYRRSDEDPDVADPDPVRELIVLDQTDVWHYGGTIEFGSDGLLYYSRGDGGGGGDPEGDAQNPLSQLGKVLRLDVDTFPVAPAGNMPEADPFVWSMGLRNVWRMAFDPCTDDLYLGDVGQNDYEEISVAPGGTAHHNFGWNTYEGNDCYEGPCEDPDPFTFPIAGYYHDDGTCAVIGGHVYRGAGIPGLRGRYFYGDICSRRIWSFRYEDEAAADPIEHTLDLDTPLLLGDYTFVSFGQDAYGELYVFDASGTIWRVAAR